MHYSNDQFRPSRQVDVTHKSHVASTYTTSQYQPAGEMAVSKTYNNDAIPQPDGQSVDDLLMKYSYLRQNPVEQPPQPTVVEESKESFSMPQMADYKYKEPTTTRYEPQPPKVYEYKPLERIQPVVHEVPLPSRQRVEPIHVDAPK